MCHQWTIHLIWRVIQMHYQQAKSQIRQNSTTITIMHWMLILNHFCLVSRKYLKQGFRFVLYLRVHLENLWTFVSFYSSHLTNGSSSMNNTPMYRQEISSPVFSGRGASAPQYQNFFSSTSSASTSEVISSLLNLYFSPGCLTTAQHSHKFIQTGARWNEINFSKTCWNVVLFHAATAGNRFIDEAAIHIVSNEPADSATNIIDGHHVNQYTNVE